MIHEPMPDDSTVEEVGDLDPERAVYYTPGGAAPVYHLKESCTRLQQNENGYREVQSATIWDDKPVCKACTDSVDTYRPDGSNEFSSVSDANNE